MFSVKSTIFKLYGFFEKSNDTYKDVNGKGIHERYNESLGEDFDEAVLPLIDDFVQNTIVPKTAFERFLSYIEFNLGLHISFYSDIPRRRKLLSLINRIYDIKGTIKAYWTMLMWDGYDTVTIVEHDNVRGFDSPFTFDSALRRYDGAKCNACFEYSIFMTGTTFPNAEKVDRAFNVVKFNEPINARLRNIYFNGSMLVENIITIYISDGTDGNKAGDLIYFNPLDPELLLRIATIEDEPEYNAGDLIIDGPNKNRYKLNQAGDLVYFYGNFYFNNALKLNGVDEFVTFTNDAVYNFGGDDFCVSFWYKPDSLGVDTIVFKDDSTNGFHVKVNAGTIEVTQKNAGLENIIHSDDLIDDTNTWYHVVINYVGANPNDWSIIVNGDIQSFTVVSSLNSISDVDNLGDVIIGNDYVNYADCYFDELFIKKGSISELEARALWNYGDGADVNIVGLVDVVLRASFDELSGLIVYDISGNDHHGTLTGLGDSTNRINH